MKITTIALIAAIPFWIFLVIFNNNFYCCNSLKINQLLIFIIISPICEEIIFRGAIQQYLNGKFIGSFAPYITKSNLITSCIFVMFHFLILEIPEILLIIFPSLIFGYLRERTNSIIPPILVHCFYNMGFMFLYIRWNRMNDESMNHKKYDSLILILLITMRF